MKHRERKNIRLRGYRYDLPGAYYVTICTHNRSLLFGEIVDGEMLLNDIGKIVDQEWRTTGMHRPEAALDEYVIMPNHIHVIIWILPSEATHSQWKDTSTGRVLFVQRPFKGLAIDPDYRREFGRPEPSTLSTIIGAFKSAVTRESHRRFPTRCPIWQKRFHDRIIRSSFELNRIRQYIRNNPMRWHLDRNRDDWIDIT